MISNKLKVSLYRYNPEEDKFPYMKEYSIEKPDRDIMVLDLLHLLKEDDQSISFRRSCREGVCGSDGMNINGKNGLACITPISSVIKRNKIAKIYKSQLNPPFFRLQKILRHNYSSFHLVLVQLNLKKFKYSYENIFKKLRKKKFFVNLHYMPLHTNPFFLKRGFKKKQFPVSEKYGNCSLSLPVYPDLQVKKVSEICKLLKSFIKKN